VIARNTAFAYIGKPLDVKTIGRDLNVRYGLEGSVQRGGARMRVNVQLIDAETGSHLWAERFDKPLADLFDMQDEIVARLAGALNARLVAAEAQASDTVIRIDRSVLPSAPRILLVVLGTRSAPASASPSRGPGNGILRAETGGRLQAQNAAERPEFGSQTATRLSNRPELRGFLSTRKPPRFAGTAW
jgi:hypothetical protein